MTLYISASLYHNDITDFGNYEIGAFCGDECRGLLSVEKTSDVEYGYLRVRSNKVNGESITFKLYDKQNDKVIPCDSVVPFVANSRKGYPSEPYKLNFGNGYVVTVKSSNIAYGTASGGGDYDSGSQVTLQANPNEGYHFDKWSNGVTENPYVFNVTENISLTAIFLPNKYKLVYKIDNEVYKSFDIDYASKITPEEEPTKEGYTFSGWSEIPTTMPSHDVEITGSFTINKYKVTFISDGVTIKEETLDFGTTITAPDAPTKTGHTFTGWNPAVDTTAPAHDVTYVAQFSINQYTITFDTDGGSEIAPITQDYNSVVTAPSNPTKTGHTFAGWEKEIPATMPAENLTIKALWTINQYTITFDTDGGSEIAPITQDYNTSITAPANPIKTGYTFAGWDKEIPATMPAENLTIKALWTINKYMLIYKVDGEVYKQYEIEYNAAITPEAAPEKEGCTFSGWSEIPATMPANDVEITGTFSVNKYLLTYQVDGEIYHQDSVAFGSAIVLIDEPVKEGKTFSGWKGAPKTMPAHDVTIVGSFNANAYTLTYKVDGEVYKSTLYEFGESIIPEPDPTKDGYTFSGWSDIPETMPSHDVEITGSFSINQYKVTFVSEGVVIKEETLVYGTPIVAPEDPAKAGHTFTGWNPTVDATVPSHDVTYIAQFSVNKYKLTYLLDGETYKQFEVEYLAAITPEDAPEKEGYTFSGWSEIPATMPANDVEVNGTFTINQYKVIFMVDGEVIKQEILDFGAIITVPENPSKVGHTFTGWTPDVAETVPSHDVTYEAQFEINTYKLTYYVDGDVYKEYEIEFGAEIIPEENPDKEGYNFSGWSEIPQYMPDHDVDVYGTFTIYTGINNIKSDSGDERIYDLSGNVIKQTRKGINIINGKKVLIK